jgi:hypothetical protein
MKGSMKNPALLGNLAGPGLPPIALNIAADYQFCVDAGVYAAEGFFDDLTAIGLHDHIALSMHTFMRSAGAVIADAGDRSSVTAQGCTDAFAAGYLGRVQQELRLFHGEGRSMNKRDVAGPPDLAAVH